MKDARFSYYYMNYFIISIGYDTTSTSGMKSSCNNNPGIISYCGGACEYAEIYGTVTITLTGNPLIDTDNYKNAIEIKCKL